MSTSQPGWKVMCVELGGKKCREVNGIGIHASKLKGSFDISLSSYPQFRIFIRVHFGLALNEQIINENYPHKCQKYARKSVNKNSSHKCAKIFEDYFKRECVKTEGKKS